MQETRPYETMYGGLPFPYLFPYQSRYHNLGLNGYIPPGSIYPGKAPGFMGDYGLRQIQDMSVVNRDAYPLDRDVMYNKRLGNYIYRHRDFKAS